MTNRCRPGAPAFTEAERDRYLVVLAATAAQLNRPPTPSEFAEACGARYAGRPYRCLAKFVGCLAWKDILGRLGYQALTAASCQQLDRQASASRSKAVKGGKIRAYCSNRPECTGKPIAPGLFFCPACDPTQRDAGMMGMGGLRVR